LFRYLREASVTEAELLSAIAEGDERALRELYDRYYPRLARFLVRMTTDDSLIAEIINDTLFVVWQKAAGFRGDASPSTWIIGICYRKAMKALARRQPAVPLADAEAVGQASEAMETRITLRRAVGRLRPKHRAIVILTYQFGYSYREISEIVHCPENTVKTRMHHARKVLKNLLETDR
jgi:RNA polymerase sigma-70 factor (ECF subfamily)